MDINMILAGVIFSLFGLLFLKGEANKVPRLVGFVIGVVGILVIIGGSFKPNRANPVEAKSPESKLSLEEKMASKLHVHFNDVNEKQIDRIAIENIQGKVDVNSIYPLVDFMKKCGRIPSQKQFKIKEDRCTSSAENFHPYAQCVVLQEE